MKWLFFFFPMVFFAGSWSEKTLLEMSLEQKIGQLFVAPACPSREEDHMSDWEQILQSCCIGNAIVKQADPLRQVNFLNRLQNKTEIPLLVVADAEWGLAMRMENTMAFPRNMTLGAIQNPQLIYRLGKEIGRQAKRVGVHINLAPVADVNNNPANPIIHMRSFGENPQKVATCVTSYIRGIQAAGILACAKHFPGHGDTAVDSHWDLPVLPHSLERLNEIELVPFRKAVSEGVSCLMSAHLLIPALDPNYPSSLSPSCLRKLMREDLHFQGLVISDALNMKALADRFSPEEIALMAVRSGCDLLLYGDHFNPHVDQILREQIPRAFTALQKGYEKGELDLASLDRTVLQILQTKEKLGLHEKRTVSKRNLERSLHRKGAQGLKRLLFQEAVTLLGDPSISLKQNVAYLRIGDQDVLGEHFTNRFSLPLNLSKEASADLQTQLLSFDQVIIALHQVDLKAKNYGLSEPLLSLLEGVKEKGILCHFVTPYALKLFTNKNLSPFRGESFKTILVGYENDPEAQRAVGNVLFGNEKAKGRLPVTP